MFLAGPQGAHEWAILGILMPLGSSYCVFQHLIILVPLVFPLLAQAKRREAGWRNNSFSGPANTGRGLTSPRDTAPPQVLSGCLPPTCHSEQSSPSLHPRALLPPPSLLLEPSPFSSPPPSSLLTVTREENADLYIPHVCFSFILVCLWLLISPSCRYLLALLFLSL